MDAESLLEAVEPENKKRPITLSQGTYGPRIGVPRILAMLRKYDIKASFFVPGISAERHPKAMEAIVSDGHEVALHGYTHDRPDWMEAEREEEELIKSKETLTRIAGTPPKGYISPAWEYSSVTLKLLEKHGVEYAADYMGEDVPFYIEIEGRQTDMVQLPVNWTLDDAPLYWFSLLPPLNYGAPYAEPSRVLELWTSEFETLYEEGAYFHLTMHPFLTGRGCRVRTLEKLIHFILLRPGVCFCEAFRVVEMYRAVVSKEKGVPGNWFMGR
jgi:peptidoglycan/xylan/chitin deacetylase (PgdA/CDA1 family)